jgi:hypothetical protein
MSHPVYTPFLAALVLSAWPAQSGAQSHAGPTTTLSPELRVAFIAEMQHLDTAIQRVVSEVARADWAALERTALEVKGSFILEQRLSAEQLAELHRVLPEAFLALDRDFHAHAERLAAAARKADAELAAFHTYRLIDACASCHARYARHRFPGARAAPEGHLH